MQQLLNHAPFCFSCCTAHARASLPPLEGCRASSVFKWQGGSHAESHACAVVTVLSTPMMHMQEGILCCRPGSPKPAPNPLQTTGTLSFAAIANSGLRPAEALTVRQPEGVRGPLALCMPSVMGNTGLACKLCEHVPLNMPCVHLLSIRASHCSCMCESPSSPCHLLTQQRGQHPRSRNLSLKCD